MNGMTFSWREVNSRTCRENEQKSGVPLVVYMALETLPVCGAHKLWTLLFSLPITGVRTYESRGKHFIRRAMGQQVVGARRLPDEHLCQ